MGRFKTALLTFIPPMIGGLVKPDGFLYAIGYAGFGGDDLGGDCTGAAGSRLTQTLRQPTVPRLGRNANGVLILLFGLGNAIVHILSSVNLLPVYQ